ncbi:MAG: penicillin-binding protein 2 [Bdellovibrionales bacterium]|nr:penicillin-binding protein 2 [Bdellovibrionales bacterium]
MSSKFVANEEEDAKAFAPRFRRIYVLIIVAGLTIFIRLWYLQIIMGTELRDFSEKNLIKETKIPAPRGLLLDREGRVLVDNLPGFEATISPQYATNLEETARVVGPILGMMPANIIALVKRSRAKNGPFRPVRIKENLSLEDVFRLKLLRLDHPGLNINETIKRHYPLHENGAQLFGYVAEISKEQISRFNQKYLGVFAFDQGDMIGKSGIEEVWERYIRGLDGISIVEVDARGRRAETESPRTLGFKPQDEIPGHNLILTIDRDIQDAAFKAMNRDDHIGNRIGSLVALKSNGEVLAWVNTPSYDPNNFSTGISPELWGKLVNDPFRPLRNKVIQDHYSPGSTFKPFVALAAVQEKIITPMTVINAPGSIRFGRRVYHDHQKGGHGNVVLAEAIERSSNVFFYKMGISLGIDKMALYAKLLGLGQLTGIGLSNEVPGLMPSRDWKLKNLGEEWQPGENLSNAIGQGYVLTNALQMAMAYSAIGQEGLLYKPFVVKKIINQDNELIADFESELVRDASIPNEDGVAIDKSTFQAVKKGLWRVANGERGTARWWKIPGVEIAGKTGTVQMRSYSAEQIYDKCELRPFNQRHHGWFVGFAPADKPEITVAILAEHACHGSTGGAPIVRDVILAYMKKYHPERIKDAENKGLKSNTKPPSQVDPAEIIE